MRLFNKIIVFLLSGFLISSSAKAQENVLTIQDVIKQAIENNYGVIISKNEIEIGSINNNWANAGAVPSINATVTQGIGINNLEQHLSNGTVTKKNGNSTQNLNAGLSVNWRVFDGMKMFASKKVLEELEKMGEYSFRKSLNETLYNVITAYYNIVTLNERLQATQEQISLYQDRFTLTQRKFDIGTGAKYEVLEAEVDLNEQKSILLSLQNSIDLAKSNLNNLLGKKPETSYQIIDTIIVQPLPLLLDAQQKIELQNPDILLANSNLFVLMQNQKVINSQRLPSVDLNGFYNFARSKSNAGFTLLNQTYGPSGSIGISVPIFNGGLVKKQLQVNDIRIKNQQILIDQTKNDLQTALNNAYINYNNALKAIELENNNLKIASQNILIATERYKKLNITSVELRQIQISYNDIKNRLYNALFQAKVSQAGIALLMGDIVNL
jgi:outer membrane protein TolC